MSTGVFGAPELSAQPGEVTERTSPGFGMILGESPHRAMAVALVDAALRKGGSVADCLQRELTELDSQLTQSHQQMQALVARTKAKFERMDA